VQPKVGGKLHLRLNIAIEVSRVGRDSAQLPLGALLGRRVSINFDRRIKVGGMWHLSGCVIALDSHTAIGIEELSAPLWSGYQPT